MKLPWNTLETFLKHSLIFLETPLKLSLNTLKTSLKHTWNFLKTHLKHHWNSLGHILWHSKCSIDSSDTKRKKRDTHTKIYIAAKNRPACKKSARFDPVCILSKIWSWNILKFVFVWKRKFWIYSYLYLVQKKIFAMLWDLLVTLKDVTIKLGKSHKVTIYAFFLMTPPTVYQMDLKNLNYKKGKFNTIWATTL